MFIVTIEYKVDFSIVEPHLPAHLEYVDRYYQSGHFLISGRKVPRTGGVILVQADCHEQMQTIIEEDPFFQADVAHFEIIEFVVSNSAEALAFLRDS